MKRLRGILLVLALLPGLTAIRGRALETAGKSALLMDGATGTVLYEKNSREPLAPASVTKVMTMLLIMEGIDSGRIGWEERVTASDTAAAKGGSQVYLRAGEEMTVTDMVKSIAVSSANDCACAMAEYLAGSEEAFVERMNARAAELGMEDTHFVNCTGLDDGENAAEHRTSARDIAIMSRELLTKHPDILKFTTIWMDTIRDGAFGLANTNKMVRFYKDCTGLKTGYTSNAGYCLSASAHRNGMDLISVVMGADSSRERFDSCRAMLDWGFAEFELYTPRVQDGASVSVRLGKVPAVRVVPGENVQLLVEKSRLGSLRAELVLEPEVSAPVSRGQRMGSLIIYAESGPLREVPMVAAEGVEHLGWGDVFALIIRNIAMVPRAG